MYPQTEALLFRSAMHLLTIKCLNRQLHLKFSISDVIYLLHFSAKINKNFVEYEYVDLMVSKIRFLRFLPDFFLIDEWSL